MTRRHPSSPVMILDFHNHFYPPEYLDALEPSGSKLRITHDDEGNPIVHYPGDYNVMVRGHRDIAYRQDVLDEHGVRMQVITLTTPGTHIEDPPVAAKLAAITNDAFATIRADRPRRFCPLATLPLCDPAASARELTRAIDELRLPGAMLFSNVNGVGLDDQRFWPIYEIADDRGAVLMIHPTYPVGVETMTEYWLMPL
ncbi:MAG TPA: amidohydrolase family protein, partial [Vicinamibacterales bacterium]|nr:amidohydrolase family protein [Vicinamibacterales bacterium]